MKLNSGELKKLNFLVNYMMGYDKGMRLAKIDSTKIELTLDQVSMITNILYDALLDDGIKAGGEENA